MKHIQLFTKGPDSCEISAYLVKIKYTRDGVHVSSKENLEDKQVWEHFFPYWNVNMVRVSQE